MIVRNEVKHEHAAGDAVSDTLGLLRNAPIEESIKRSYTRSRRFARVLERREALFRTRTRVQHHVVFGTATKVYRVRVSIIPSIEYIPFHESDFNNCFAIGRVVLSMAK